MMCCARCVMTGKSIRLEKSPLFLFFLIQWWFIISPWLGRFKGLLGSIWYFPYFSTFFLKRVLPHHFNCIMFLLGRFQITSGPEQDRNSDRCCIRALFCFVFLCTLYYYIIVPLFYFLGLYSFLFNENSLTKSTAVIYGQPTLFIYFCFIFSPFIFLLSRGGFEFHGVNPHESTPAESHSTPPLLRFLTATRPNFRPRTRCETRRKSKSRTYTPSEIIQSFSQKEKKKGKTSKQSTIQLKKLMPSCIIQN